MTRRHRPRRDRFHTPHERVAALETSVESLSATVNHLAEAVTRQGQEFSAAIHAFESSTREAVDRLHREVNEITKPKWQNLIAGLSLVIVLMTAIGGMALAPLYMTAGQNTREAYRVHDELSEELAQTKAMITSEMDHRFATVKEEFRGADRLHDRELAMFRQIEDERYERLTASLDELRREREAREP